MKLLKILSYSFLLFAFFTFSNCKKNNPSNPIDQLPPETQTGANTFGCLVNGQVFIPSGAILNGGSLKCNYQYLGGGYYFRLAATKGSGDNTTNIGLFTDSLKISENQMFILDSAYKGSSYGLYLGLGDDPSIWKYQTKKPNYSGHFKIKKLDSVMQIVSGVFSYDAVNGAGQKVEIREGRFDVHYTR